MKSRVNILAVVLFSLVANSAFAATRYVNINNTAPAPPYADWGSAATNIQDAVDAATAGDDILVTNGLYQSGAQPVYGVSNRLAVTKAVTVRSVNGPAVTTIVGSGSIGQNDVRCVYLTNEAVLAGFTLTNGATSTKSESINESGGGVWCESGSAQVTNCVLTGNSASFGGGAFCGTLNNCTLTGNGAASCGGGAFSSTLNNCTLTSNSTGCGGGAYASTLDNCTLTGNSAEYGGGTYGSALDNCTLTGNSASLDGGGACEGTLDNCTLTGNSASSGGGADSATLNNCTLTANLASSGGGANSATLNNCTLTGNSASSGGGAAGGTLNNCIIYYNTAPSSANCYSNMLNYCCTTPLPAGGVGNTDAEPQLASTSHLSAGSPCRGTGSAIYASGTDIDGEPWANPPSIGCDEYWSGSVTGALSATILASYTNVAAGFAVDFQGLVAGRVSASRWDFGDGEMLSNRPWASHAWAVAGDYVVELRAYNETYVDGIAASVTVRVPQSTVHYVALTSATPVPPYNSWTTAATNIQDAVDAAVPGALIWVTNGVYQNGARAVYGMSNRVAVSRPVTVRSVNGPAVTSIVGYQDPVAANGPAAIRCVYLTNGTVLAGFTLTNGATQTSGDFSINQGGGGVWCESAGALLTNCALMGNSAAFYGGGAAGGTLNNCTLAANSALYGGGAFGATLNNCTLTANSASQYGGGANSATLNNCTVTGNSAFIGGGSMGGTLNNCILYYNTAPTGRNYYGLTFNYCCTTPLVEGPGNFTNAPLFVNTNRWGNLRLQSNSPCINAGFNAYASALTDLDGNPRIVSGTVDIGAYEYQGPGSLISYAWLQQYSLPTDGSADFADPDGDGRSNWQEWRCGTDPRSALSVLRLLSPTPSGTNLSVSWQSVAGVSYFLESSTNLSASPTFTLLATNVVGQAGTTTYTDANAPGVSRLYRIGVSSQ